MDGWLWTLLKMPWYKDYIDDHYQMRPEFIGLKVAVIHNALDNIGWSKVFSFARASRRQVNCD